MTRNNEDGTSAAGENYPGFLKLAAGILVSLMVLGALPTFRWAGNEGLWSMVMGCGVSLVGSVVGTMPLVASRGRSPVETMPMLIGSIVLRMVVVMVVALAVALSGLLATKPFLVWVASSHLGLLVADTLFARGHVRLNTEAARRERPEDG